jgi:hypothetical protein
MKMDFHVHGTISSKLEFNPTLFRQMTRHASLVGLDAIALTDHFDSCDYLEIHHFLANEYQYEGDCYLADGIKIFPGIEVEIDEGPHLLVIGGRDEIAAFYRRLDGRFEPGRYINVWEYFKKQEGLNTLSIFAHPVRPHREMDRVHPSFYSRFAGLDLNARDLYLIGDEVISQVNLLSDQSGVPVIAGSDTHHYLQLGSVVTNFTSSFNTLDELRNLIASRAYSIVIEPGLKENVGRAREMKKALVAKALGS